MTNNKAKQKQEIKDLLLDSSAKLSDILRQSLVFAKEYDETAVSWITKEINGYANGETCPEYRKVSGVPRVRNDAGVWGVWVPPPIPGTDSQDILQLNTANSVASLEEIIGPSNNSWGYIRYPDSTQRDFNKLYNKPGWEFFLKVPKSEIASVLERIRSKLADWLIDSNTNYQDALEAIDINIIFPEEFLEQIPSDVRDEIDDFNFNYSHKRIRPCMYIMRRILLLSMIRKFQIEDREGEIKKDGDFLTTKSLLELTRRSIDKRTYEHIYSSKMLLDASQHSFTYRPTYSEVERIATRLRLFLADLFPPKKNGS